MVTNLAPITKSPVYVKVANFPGLYRHSRSGRYYGCEKLGGIRREKGLETCDRKIAERRLKEWIGNLDKVDAEDKKTTIGQLIQRFQVVTGAWLRTPTSPTTPSSTASGLGGRTARTSRCATSGLRGCSVAPTAVNGGSVSMLAFALEAGLMFAFFGEAIRINRVQTKRAVQVKRVFQRVGKHERLIHIVVAFDALQR